MGKEKRKSVRGEGEKKRKKNVTYDREVSRDWRARLNEFWFLVFGFGFLVNSVSA